MTTGAWKMTLPPKPAWFEFKITIGTLITAAATVFGIVWGAGQLVATMNEHTARLEATEVAHYQELRNAQQQTAASVAVALTNADRRRADLQEQEREDIREIRALLDKNIQRHGGLLVLPEAAEEDPG